MTQCNDSDREGLYAKYEVRKGSEPVEDCFVLRPDRDAAARVALLAYAYATDDLKLRGDLHRWVQAIQDALGPDEQAAVMRSVYESALAAAVSKADAARREAESAEFALEYTQQTFVAALPGQEKP